MTDLPPEYLAMKQGFKPNGAGEPGHTLPAEWWQEIEIRGDDGDFVEGLLCDGALSLLWGESGCGKTHLAVDLAFHIAAGRAWFGRQVERGAVLYLACEGGSGIRKRIVALKQCYADHNIPFVVTSTPIDLAAPAGDGSAIVALAKCIGEQAGERVRLIIIDTLSRAMAGADENGSDGMGGFVRNVDQIRQETGAHVMIVHHAGKDASKGARGHSLLRAACDTEIQVERDQGTKVAVARVTKQRDLDCAGEFGFRLDLIDVGTDRRGRPITSCVVVEIEGAASLRRGKPAKSLSPKLRLALDKFEDLMDREGKRAPPNEHIPDGACVISEKAFRAHLRATGAIPESGVEGERSGWKRAHDGLLEAREIGQWHDSLWRIRNGVAVRNQP